MFNYLQNIRKLAPEFALQPLRDLRDFIAPPRNDDDKLHEYCLSVDGSTGRRINLVLPTIAPDKMFGGVSTALEIVGQVSALADADLRLILDDFDTKVDYEAALRILERVGLERTRIRIEARLEQVPRVSVRREDVFFTYNWWITLNSRSIIKRQTELFSMEPGPLVYLVQDYEPGFYAFSSSHLLALRALSPGTRCWAVINSQELADFIKSRGHVFGERFVFHPTLNAKLKSALHAIEPKPQKRKIILVYGRPGIPRNCYGAMLSGLKTFVRDRPEFTEWQFVSVGMKHKPVQLGEGRYLNSMGKLDLNDYAHFLAEAGVGVSLMASPHPSYPPLEMANFGVVTVTNTYANKDLSRSHENIISLPDIEAKTLSDALGQACGQVDQNPLSGWRGRNLRSGYLETGDTDAFKQIVKSLKEQVWD